MELLRRSGAAEGWLDEGGHAVLTAVSRLTPGTNVLAYCACFGWLVSGWLGAVYRVSDVRDWDNLPQAVSRQHTKANLG